jgi:hypothetical protein
MEGYRHTPPEFSDEEGCMLNTDFRAALKSENAAVNSDVYGPISRPTACKSY